MQEDATSQDLDPMSREDTPQSWSGEDTPQSYVKKDSSHVNPISGEDSGHTSILCQEKTVNTPQSLSGDDTYISGEDSEHTSILI